MLGGMEYTRLHGPGCNPAHDKSIKACSGGTLVQAVGKT